MVRHSLTEADAKRMPTYVTKSQLRTELRKVTRSATKREKTAHADLQSRSALFVRVLSENIEKTGQRLGDEIRSSYLALEYRISDEVGRIDKRIDALETRLDSMETRLGSVEARLDSLETRFDSFEKHLETIELRISKSVSKDLQKVLQTTLASFIKQGNKNAK